jgi:protein-S-isoprenylcysteine O-methyltransferase Ste14
MFIALVFKTNSYASRVVEVTKEQKVISSGPYSVVRHPMYSGMLLLYIATPVALASWWGTIPATLLIPAIVLRILNEEQILKRELEGYTEYCKKVRFHLIPFIW